ncbi:MAG TPA: T9SS type A sorting domain-containing protein, partial [Cryomorphaceae bacterium]|nr:T9SS type A sorting domain-containing protein [Cryomorphaceae bacterium]
PEEIKFSLDGSVYYIYSPAVQNAETWPFTEDQYLLLNFAIQENISPFFEEDAMILDYIRVYQEGNPTSVNEVEKSKLNVYPNPANDYLVIETPNNDLNAEIEIYTLLGVKVLSQKVSAIKTRVSLNEFPKGAYLTTVRTNSGVFNQTFIVSE